MKRVTTSITITDPLVKYQSLLATGLYTPDPAQHRLAVHLQKIYRRLKDYSPSTEYRARLKAISDTLEEAKPETQEDGGTLAVDRHPIWRNPLFSRFFARTESKDSLALTRVLTSHEAAININSPRGLFLSGEVGTGKSMLLDLLADGLPTSRKRRWHFNTFMLYAVSRLEQYRRTHSQLGRDDQQYSLLWLAKDMAEKSPILFLDEFQLPDRAASKILSNLFTAFFQLGGVLVASSNRMPEELEKATGYEYAAPSPAGLLSRALGIRPKKAKGELFGSSSDFANFLEVLKARCEFWQMEGGKDWRRRDTEETSHPASAITAASTSLASANTTPDTPTMSAGVDDLDPNGITKTPKNYLLVDSSNNDAWLGSIQALTPSTEPIPWAPATLTVYGRAVNIPQQHDGIVYWDFDDLVSTHGPADYITMASNFHTFIINRIPVLSVLKKNEARRLITLLDALYEARCKLIVRAEAGPDDLFFPEAKSVTSDASQAIDQETMDNDAILPETIAEVYQDQLSPFRPNISTYSEAKSDEPSPYDPDQDSDFGIGPRDQSRRGPDFSNTGAFTGEDERFAYKRAASRLWELCGARWHARTGEWWCPLPLEARHWEGGHTSLPGTGDILDGTEGGKLQGDVSMGASIELDEPAGLQRLRIEHLRKAVLGETRQAKEDRQAEKGQAGDRFARSRGNSSDGFE